MNQLPELGPESNKCLYGLLDLEHNFFYQVHFEKSVLENLCDLIKDNRSTVVVALHTCSNWHRNLVDHTNCWNWGLGVFCAELRLDSMLYNQTNLIQTNYQVVDKSLQILINNLDFAFKKVYCKIPVEIELLKYKLPDNLLTLFADDQWVKKNTQLEIQYYDNYKKNHDYDIKKIQSFARDLAISDPDYCDQLTKKINQYCLQVNDFLLKLRFYV